MKHLENESLPPSWFILFSQLEFGVVYSCLEDKMYKARKGQGAFCNDELIQVSDVKGKREAMEENSFAMTPYVEGSETTFW